MNTVRGVVYVDMELRLGRGTAAPPWGENRDQTQIVFNLFKPYKLIARTDILPRQCNQHVIRYSRPTNLG